MYINNINCFFHNFIFGFCFFLEVFLGKKYFVIIFWPNKLFYFDLSEHTIYGLIRLVRFWFLFYVNIQERSVHIELHCISEHSSIGRVFVEINCVVSTNLIFMMKVTAEIIREK